MQWYRLTSDGSEPADQAMFRARVEQAMGALGLSSRPGFKEWLRREDGCILVFDPDAVWLCLWRGDEQTASMFARAARAVARPVDEPPECLDAQGLSLAHAVVPWGARLSRAARETDGATPRIEAPAGGFISLNIRRAGWLEARRVADWVSDEFNTTADSSKLRDAGACVARVECGAPTPQAAETGARMAAGAMGAGLSTNRAHPASWDRWMPPAGLAAACLSTLTGAVGLPGLVGSAWWVIAAVMAVIGGFLAAGWLFAFGAAVMTGLAAWWAWAGLADMMPLWASIPLTLGLAAAGVWLARPAPDPVWAAVTRRPRHFLLPVARGRRADSSDVKTRFAGNDDHAPAFVAGYPLHRSSLPVAPTALIGLATPTGATVTGATRAPDELTGPDGPMIGRDVEGRAVRIPVRELYGGIAVVGEPGSGKSNLLHGLLGQIAAGRRPGQVIIDFEVKGSDSIPILKRLMGPRLAVCRPADPSGPMIDPTGAGGPWERAGRFSDLMAQALGETAVGPRSRMQMKDAAGLAMMLTETDQGRELASKAGLEAGSWLQAASELLGAAGIPQARRWAAAAARLDGQAVERLGLGLGANGKPVTADGRLAEQLGAPMNKLDALGRHPAVWAPRRRLTWRDVLERGLMVVVDLSGLDDQANVVGAMMLESLRAALIDVCEGWGAAGRTVTVCCDELSVLAGSGPRCVEWFREQGRSYGVRPLFATQNAGQLDERLARSLLGFRTLVSFSVQAPSVASQVAESLGQSDGAWTAAQVAAIARYHAAVRAAGSDGRLPVCVVSVPDFDDASEAA